MSVFSCLHYANEVSLGLGMEGGCTGCPDSNRPRHAHGAGSVLQPSGSQGIIGGPREVIVCDMCVK